MTAELQRLLAKLRDDSNRFPHLEPFNEEFFTTLIEAIREAEYNPIREARRVISEAFKADPSFRQVYVDNVACVIMDHDKILHGDVEDRGPLSNEHRQHLADAIVRHLFDDPKPDLTGR